MSPGLLRRLREFRASMATAELGSLGAERVVWKHWNWYPNWTKLFVSINQMERSDYA